MKTFIKNLLRKLSVLKGKIAKLKDSQSPDKNINILSLPVTKKTDDFIDRILSFGLIFRVGIIILFVIYLGYIFFNALDVIYAILTAFILSMAVERFILFFSKFFPRGFSIILTYIILFLFLTLGFVILIPFLITNLSNILTLVLNKITLLEEQLQNQQLVDLIHSLHLHPFFEKKFISYISDPNVAIQIKDILVTNVSNILQTFAQSLKTISTFTITIITGFFNAISQILIIFTLAVFFSFDKERVVYIIANLSKNPRKTGLKLERLYNNLSDWLKGQFLLGLFIGLAVYFGLLTLSLFGINLESKGTLALIAGLMEFIPYLGPILGALPALLVAILSYGFSGFIWIGLLFIIIQQVEGWIVPIVMNKALGVSPLLIIIAMLFGMKMMGLIGIILAIPFAVIISLLFEDNIK